MVESCGHSLITSRGEDLEIEEPVVCRDYTSFHFHPTWSSMLGALLIRYSMAPQNCSCDRTSFGGRTHALCFPLHVWNWQFAMKQAIKRVILPLLVGTYSRCS